MKIYSITTVCAMLTLAICLLLGAIFGANQRVQCEDSSLVEMVQRSVARD